MLRRSMALLYLLGSVGHGTEHVVQSISRTGTGGMTVKDARAQEAREAHFISRMCVMDHWSARKQHLHPQSVAEISRYSALSEDRIQQCGTSSGSRRKDIDQCL